MKKRQFIFIVNKNSMLKYNFNDLKFDKRAIILNDTIKNINNDVLKMMRKIHLSEKINQIINLPFKSVWGSSLDDITWDNNTMYYVIFKSPYPIDVSYLKEKKKKYDVKYILFVIDPWDDDYSKYAREYAKNIHFDYIFTIDQGDAEKYNFIFNDTYYSILPDNSNNEIEYDLYSIAINRGRLKKLYGIYEYLNNYDVSSMYRITGVPTKDIKLEYKIIYNKFIEYPQIISELKRCNCILEVMKDNQVGATARYYEAVCYNKKLLTTNKNVVNLPFYNPKYIHIFEKPEDIDCDWVKERIPVDYGYDGRFSPVHLIDKIIELEEQKEGKEDG